MNGTNYEVPRCGDFSTPHSHPSRAQIQLGYLEKLILAHLEINMEYGTLANFHVMDPGSIPVGQTFSDTKLKEKLLSGK